MREDRNPGAGRAAVDGGAYPLVVAIDASKLRRGRVRGRYFRENFAQAGIDLSQIIPELVTNADAAIAAAGRERGRVQLRIGAADAEFLRAWKTALRTLRLPALHGWRYELVCSDDGEGVDADLVDQRLGATPARRLLRARRRRGRILRGRKRRVARAPAQLLLDLLNAGLETLIPRPQRGDEVHTALPPGVVDRLRLVPLHAAGIRRKAPGPCSGAERLLGIADLQGFFAPCASPFGWPN